jgi:hypothetical protein
MQKSKINRILFFVGVVTIAAALTGCPEFLWSTYDDVSHTSTKTMLPGDTLIVLPKTGDVAVSAWDQDKISVTYTKHVRVANEYGGYYFDPTPYFSQIGVSVAVSANTPGLTVEVTMPDRGHEPLSRSVDLDIKVPSDVDVDISGEVGDVSVEGVSGVIGVAEEVGDIEVTYPTLPEEDEAIVCATDVGDIDVLVPEDSSFVCDLRTGLGVIDVFDFWPLRAHRWNTLGAQCAGTVGSGGAEVTLNSNIGDISLRIDY